MPPMKNITTLFICLIVLSAQANWRSNFKLKGLPIEQTKKSSDSLKFSIFPNPLKEQRLFIESNGSTEKHIQIYNVLGEKKFEMHTYENAIILDRLETGIYLFYLKQGEQKGYKRLVIH
jgi:hypothetical protein